MRVDKNERSCYLKPMHETKEKILQQALQLVSLYGLESLSIGQLAKDTKMSKSGLFAHFQSKENLQIEVLRYATRRYEEAVFLPAIAAPRGVPRIEALVTGWSGWIGSLVAGDCPILASLTELDEREGPVQAYLFSLMTRYIEALAKMAQIAVDEGQFKDETDTQQFAFELISALFGYQATRKLPWDSSKYFHSTIESLINRHRSA